MGKARAQQGKPPPPKHAEQQITNAVASNADAQLHRLLARALDPYYEVPAETAIDLAPLQPGFLLVVDDFLSASECALTPVTLPATFIYLR